MNNAMIVTCSNCQAQFQVSVDLVGKQGSCFQCQAVLTIGGQGCEVDPISDLQPVIPPVQSAPSPQQFHSGARAPNSGQGMAISSLVLGIVSLVFFCVPFVGLACAIIGLVLGAVAMNEAPVHGMAVGGVVMSIIGIAIPVLMFMFSLIAA